MSITYDADGVRQTVLVRARRFFAANPEEMLTREDMQAKFGCSLSMANLVSRQLIAEGAVKREQLPRAEAAGGRKAPATRDGSPDPSLPLLERLTRGQRAAIELIMHHGSMADAARATGRKVSWFNDHLRDARVHAGVHSTLALALRYQAELLQAREEGEA